MPNLFGQFETGAKQYANSCNCHISENILRVLTSNWIHTENQVENSEYFAMSSLAPS